MHPQESVPAFFQSLAGGKWDKFAAAILIPAHQADVQINALAGSIIGDAEGMIEVREFSLKLGFVLSVKQEILIRQQAGGLQMLLFMYFLLPH